MNNREKTEVVGAAVLVAGAAMVSPALAMMLAGGLVLLASIVGRAIQCFRR